MAVPGVCRLSVNAGSATLWIHEPTKVGVEGAVLVHQLKSSIMQCVTQRSSISAVYVLVTGEADMRTGNRNPDRVSEQLKSVLAAMDLLECPVIGLLAGSASILSSVLLVHCDDLAAVKDSELQFGGAVSTQGMPVEYGKQVGLVGHLVNSGHDLLEIVSRIPVSKLGSGPDTYRLKCEIRTRSFPFLQLPADFKVLGLQPDLRCLAEAIEAGLARLQPTPAPSFLPRGMRGLKKPSVLNPLSEDIIFEDDEASAPLIDIGSLLARSRLAIPGNKFDPSEQQDVPVSQLLSGTRRMMPPSPPPPQPVKTSPTSGLFSAKPEPNEKTIEGDITSLMLCNIPCRISQDTLLEVVESLGFKDKYDFLYLPIGGRPSSSGAVSNLGYGFINFLLPEYAEEFSQAFLDYRFKGTSSTKVCAARPAHVQGFYNNVERLSSTSSKLEPRGRDLSLMPKESLQALAMEGLQALATFNSKDITFQRIQL